jgi:hypothetical protein
MRFASGKLLVKFTAPKYDAVSSRPGIPAASAVGKNLNLFQKNPPYLL